MLIFYGYHVMSVQELSRKKGHIFNVLKYFFSSQLIILWGQEYDKLELEEILIRIGSEQDNKSFVL